MTARALVLFAAAVLGGCVPTFDPRTEGEACSGVEECAADLVCAHDAVCRPIGTAGTGREGDPCAGTSGCALNLECAADGTCQMADAPGTAAFDETCASDDDCQFGLRCFDGVCKGLELPFWPGTTCPEDATDGEAEGAARVFFEVPRGEPLADFYRLPFPSDVRVSSTGELDLDGHPTPGALIERLGDPVADAVRVVELDLDGRFGTNQAAYLRFSRAIDHTTLDIGLPGRGQVALVDLDSDAEEPGVHPFRYVITDDRTPYICHNWLAVHPLDGRPAEPGHTYAVLVGRGVTAEDGDPIVADADFQAMLGAEPPPEPGLRAAWDAHAKLRAWIDRYSLDVNTLIGAAVFTVQDPTVAPQLLRDAVHADEAPTATDPILCGDGADPFADPEDDRRGCSPASDRFHELQLTVRLPQFQDGTPPFKDFGDGGRIDVREGTPAVQRREDVHVAITVPDAPMPAGGWPVVLYGHGTGGSYTSIVRSGLAEALSGIDRGPDGTVGFAMIGFDAPLHGPRRHPENFDAAWLDLDPEAYDEDVLFFNPLNPRAARDNALQEAADLWSLVRWLGEAGWSDEDSPTGEAIAFDLDQLHYVGHSQGGVAGPVFAAWEPEVDTVTLSGAGGLTIQSLIHKTSPHDLPAALRVGLADPDISREHPILNLVQAIAERADGVNHARYLLRTPPEGFQRKHVLQIFGVGDTYSPDETQEPLLRQLGVPHVRESGPPLENIETTSLPVSANRPGSTTGVAILYAAASRDAHFVLFDRADALHHLETFLATAVTDGVPTVEPL